MTSFCTGFISRKLCRFLFMFSTVFTSLILLLLFPQSISFFNFGHGFYSISSNINEVLSINTSANVFVFGDFDIYYKDWLTYFGGNERPGELCYNFSISNDLTQIVNFPTWIPDCDSWHSPARDIVLLFWIYFFLLMLVFVLQWFFLHWEILIIMLSQFPLTFQLIDNRMSHFIA